MNEEQLQAQVAQMLQNGASEQEIDAFVAEYDSTNAPAQTQETDPRLIGLVKELQKKGATQQEIDDEIFAFDQNVKKMEAAPDVTAPAAAETPVNTESQSANGSSDFQPSEGPSQFADPLEPSILEPASFEQEYNLDPILTNGRDIGIKVDDKFSDIPAEQIKNKDFNLTLNSITKQMLEEDDLLSTFYEQITPTLQPKIDARINELKESIDLTSEEAVAKANKDIQSYIADLYNDAYQNSTSVKQRRDEILNAVNRKVNDYATELYNAEADRIAEENENTRKAKAQVLIDFHPILGAGPFKYLPNDFRTSALQTMTSFVQSLDYTQMHAAGVNVAKANEAIEKINSQDAEIDKALAEGEIGPKRAEQLRSTFEMPGTGRPIKYQGRDAETKEEALAGLQDMKTNAGKEFLKQIAEGQEYQKTIETLGSGPQLFNENGELSSFSLDAENFNKGMGSQTVQMLLSTVGGTVPQEIAGMTMEALEAVVTKNGDPEATAKFYSLSQKEQNQKMLEAIDNGDVDLDNIVGAAFLSGVGDMASGYLTLGGVKLAPKGVINNLFKGRARRGVAMRNLRKNLTDPSTIAQFTKILATETGTEALQENLSMSTASAASGYDLFNKARMMEAAGLALITTGPITSVSTGIRKAKNEAYRGFSGLMSEDAIRSSINRKKADLEQSYKDGEISAQEVSDKIDELNATEDVLYNTPKIQKFEPEAKENIIKNQIEKTKLERENQEIEQTLMGDFTIFGKGKKAKNEEKLAKLEDERNGIIYQQQMLNSARRFRGFVNDNKDFFNGYTFKFFNTKEDLKQWAEDNDVNYNDEKNAHLKGAIEGKAFGVKLPEQKVFLAVKETADSARGSFLNRLAGGNVVFHEGAHAVMDSATDEEIAELYAMMDEFAKQNPDTKYGQAWNMSKTVTEGTSAKEGREFNEEVFARMSDMSRSDLSLDNVSVGDVTVLSKIGDKLADFFNLKAKGAVDFSGFKNAEEVITFFDKYNNYNNKPIKSISLPVAKGAEQGEDITPASEVLVQEVRFEDDSINEQFKEFTYDGKVNNAPESFHAMAAYQYEPLAQSVVNTLANKGIASGSAEQNNLIMGYLEDATNRQELVEQLVIPVGGNQASSLLGLAKTYNPEIGSFGGYAKGFLAARAIRQLENKMKASFIGSQKIDAPESKEIEAGEQEVQDVRSVFEKFNFSNEIKTKADGLVEVAVLNVEKKIKGKELSNAKKISERTKGLSDVYKRIAPDIKKAIGKGQAFDDFLNANWKNIGDAYIDNVVVSKGRGGGISPFSEGFTKEDIVDYFKGNDLIVGQLNKNDKPLTKDQKTRAVSTRKTRSLPEAISRQIANESLKSYVADNPEINEQFQKDYGFALASEVLKDLKSKDQKSFEQLTQNLKRLDNDFLNNHKYNFKNALNDLGVSDIFKDIYGEKFGNKRFDKLVSDFEKEFSSMEKVEPTFEYNGKKYTLAEFITDKILSEIENDSYALQVKTITGRDLKLDWGDAEFISKVQESYAKLGAVMGRQWMDRYLSKGLKAPSKIGNGTLTVDDNFNLVFSDKEKGTNRFGVFQNTEHYNTWADSQNFPNKPISANEFVTDSAKPFHKWAAKSRTPEGITAIQLSGISDNQAFIDLIDTVKDLGIGIDETVGMLMSMNNNPLGLTRRSAILDFIPTKAFEGEYLLEHMTPALVINLAALDYIHNKRTDPSNFKKLMKTYRLAQLPKKYDDIVNEYYKSHMPFYFKPGDVSLVRYYNPEIAERFDLKLKQISTGTVIDKGYYKSKSAQKKSKDESLAVFDLADQKALASEVIFEPNTPGDFSEASTAYKAIFMVGSPGGGKTNVGKGLRLGRRGYKVVNQDIALEALKKAAGLPENESNYTKEQKSLRSKLGSQAVKAGKDKFQQYKNEGKGFLVDGTGASYNATTKKINELKEAGYDVYLVAAMTPKKVAIERNKARKERSLPTFVVSKSYDQVVESLAKYKQDYGDKVFEIDTTTIGFGEALPQEFLDKVYNGITQTKVAKSTLDKVAESKALASEKLSDEFNQMLERVKGVKAEARYSEARATKLAQSKGRFKFFVPYSAEDYMGLIYPTLGKGKEGDQNLEWYKENILKPFARGISNFESAKQEAMSNWRSLKKSLKGTPAALGKEAVRGFSNEDAVRVYLWNERDVVPESLSKKDTEALVDYVNSNKTLKAFAEQVVDITEGVDYPAPQKDWMIGTLTTDLVNFVNTAKRSDFLEEWQNNVDIVYSKDNMNKLKAIYGENYVDALENMLYRMKTGRNRPSGQSKIENQFQNWINDSVGTVMFFNTRSAVLQTISAVNFLNWSDNNPIKAGIAFANQPQFWSDFAYLFNSDFLKQRRSGLKNDVNADEIAREAAGATNKYKAALNALLKAGFSPTQIADSFAIAVGGASFYRNRLNTYLKQGMDQKQAEEAAMLDFKETAEESQQSSRPDKVSMEQASSLGRIILAFANTPAQYTRLTKRAAQDLINGRGDWKTNVSKLLYYGAVQNIIFTALQQALFALSFDDEEDEEEIYTKTANGIVDTLLRGSGVYGAGVATLKNMVMEAIRQAKSKRPDYTKAALKITTLSPPVDTKIRKLMSAGRAFTYKQNKKDMRTMGWDVDNPAALAVGQVASAIGNVPLDRAIIKMQNLKDATNSEYETYQRVFLALGWSDWQLGIKDDKSKKKRAKTKGLKQPKVEENPFEQARRERAELLESIRKGSPAKRLERGVAGKAHRDGTIEVDPNLSPVEREKTIAHEKQHVKDIKAGKLDYDDNYVYWNGKKYPRKNGKIKYKGNWVEEGHPSLPWEKKAYDAEPSTKEIKEKKKRTKLY